MGILSKFLKPKPPGPESENSKERQSFLGRGRVPAQEEEKSAPEAEPAAAASAEDVADKKQGRAISFGLSGGAKLVPSPATQRNINISKSADMQVPAHDIVPVKAAVISDEPIKVEFDELVSQIPANLLKSEASGAKKTLLFSPYKLMPGLSHGKVTVPVSLIAELAPDFFKGTPSGETMVELPLKKIVAQIGTFPCRPDQVEEIYAPLDAKFAKLVVEKGAPVKPAQPAPAPSVPVAAVPVVATPAAAEPAAVAPAEVAPVEEKIPEPIAPAAPEPKAETPAPVEPEPPAAVEETPDEPAAEPAEPEVIENVTYSFAAIFPNVPKPWISGDLNSVDDLARLTVPFHLVDAQLASGRVELHFAEFFNALPGELKKHFTNPGGNGSAGTVLVPLSEVFQNLPGAEPPPPPRRRAKPEPEAVAAPVAVEEPKPVIEEPVAEPIAKTEPKVEVAEPVAPAAPIAKEEVPAPAPEEIKPAPVEAKAPEAPTAPVEETPVVEEPQTAPKPEAKAEPPAEEVPAPIEEPAKTEEQAAPEPSQAIEEPAAPAEPAPEPPKPQVASGTTFMPPVLNLQRLAPSTALLFANRPPAPVSPEPEPATPLPGEAPVAHVEPVAQATPVEQTAPEPTTEESVAETVHEPVSESAAEPAAEPSAPLVTGDMFVTNGKYDSKKTVEHLILLPGIKAAAITIKGKTRNGGQMPSGFSTQETGKAASALFHALEGHGSTAQGAPRVLTIHHDGFSSTFFKQGGVLLCVIHPGRAPEEETHHALLLAMREIALARQH